MIRRPKPFEREEDILSLQEEFLLSKSQPSASLVDKKLEGRKKERDVVSLQGPSKVISEVENVKPGTSKFKQRHEKSGMSESKSTTCEVLNDAIQERDIIAGDPLPLAVYHSKLGFPLVQKLSETKTDEPTNQKKSLFAQQFESLTPEEFGLVILDTPESTPKYLIRDKVKPTITEYQEKKEMNKQFTEKKMNLEGFDSSSSVTWDRFLRSSLVSGQGLSIAGASPEFARKEVEKIHEENVLQLSAMTEDEIQQEQEKMKKLLGPDTVAFLKSRNKKDPSIDRHEEAPPVGTDKVKMETSTEGLSNLSNKHGWVHMNVLENEKLGWIKDLPVAMETPKKYREIRFSFDGLVIQREVGVAIPVHLSLHHHGDEPEAAGYTLGELFQLFRSSVIQQRVLTLKTFASIIERARHNEYYGIIEGSTLDTLLELGLPLLLRYSLDESSESVQTEAIHCLHSLLVSSSEESFLNTYSSCYQGLSLPELSCGTLDHSKNNEDVIKKDVVEGLLRMMLLPRLRYILEVCQPSLDVTSKIFEILIRIARQSLNASSQIASCPRLVEFIMNQFLAYSDNTTTQIPHPKAMQMIRTLCSAGRHITKNLLSTHNILECILRYIVVHPSVQFPESDSSQLYIESIRTWTVILSYGLTTDTFSDIFPTFLQQLSTYSPLSVLSANELKQQSAFFNLLTSSIHASAITPSMLVTAGKEMLSQSCLTWSHAMGVVDPALHCLNATLKEIQEYSHEEDIDIDRVQYISSLQHLIATYYTELSNKPELQYKPVDLLKQVESVVSSVIISFQGSKLFLLALNTLRSSIDVFASSPSSPNLSSFPIHVTFYSPKSALYGCDPMTKGDYPRLSHVHSVLVVFADILRSHVRMCYALTQLHHGVTQEILKAFLSDSFMRLLETVRKLTTDKVTWIMNPLLLLVCAVLKLFVSNLDKLEISKFELIQSCAFNLFTLLSPGLEVCAVEIMSTILFHPLFYKEIPVNSFESKNSESHFTSHTRNLLSSSIAKLTSMKQIYFEYLQLTSLQENKLTRSIVWFKCNPVLNNTLLLPSYTGPIIPVDWPYIPLIVEYSNSVNSDLEVTNGPTLSNILHYLILLEHCHGDIISTTPTTARLTRIMCIFLIDSDLFLEPDIHSCLSSLLHNFSSSSLDFTSVIPGLPSFHDLYSSLLEQFAAVSYGDQLFSMYIMLPLQQKHSSSFRKAFWFDYSHSLRIITLTHTQLPISLDSFLYPIEQEWDLLEQYLRVLASGTLHSERNPFLFLIAVHHIHSFIFHEESEKNGLSIGTENEGTKEVIVKRQTDKDLRKCLLQQVIHVPNKTLQHTILLYSSPCKDGGLDLADTLSDSQILVMSTLEQSPPSDLQS